MEADNKNKEPEKHTDANFDMYHFISRKDVILAALFILALLVFFLFLTFSGGDAHATALIMGWSTV